VFPHVEDYGCHLKTSLSLCPQQLNLLVADLLIPVKEYLSDRFLHLWEELEVIRTHDCRCGDIQAFMCQIFDTSSHMSAQYHETLSVNMCKNTATLLQHWIQVLLQEITIVPCVDSMVPWECSAQYDTIYVVHYNQYKLDITWFLVEFVQIRRQFHLTVITVCLIQLCACFFHGHDKAQECIPSMWWHPKCQLANA
jgi:hypothetical protein